MRNYRAAAGPGELYDKLGALQFNLMTILGLRERHTLLDIGCGSLRAGRLFIMYLTAGNYFGVEPVKWMVAEAIENEVSQELGHRKQPHFYFSGKFDLTYFPHSFDYLLACSVFSHAPLKSVRVCLEEAASVMHGESIFAFTWVKGKDYKGTEWVSANKARGDKPGGKAWVTYSTETIKKACKDAGLYAEPIHFPHPAGQSWMIAAPYVRVIDAAINKLPMGWR